MNDVRPFEETDPEVAELFMDVANKRYDRFNIKRIIETDKGIILIPYKIYNTGGRNEPCSCGSGIKTKKCTCMELFK